MYSMTLPRTTT